MLKQFQYSLVLPLALVFVSLSVHANLLEDMFGVGSRSKAMGGAGVAAANDYSATFYNPALLTTCNNSSVELGYNGIISELWNSTESESRQLDVKNNVSIGSCIHLPLRFTLGVFATLNPVKLAQIEMLHGAPTKDPIFPLYRDGLGLPTANTSLAFKIFDNLSIGVGLSITIEADIAGKSTLNGVVTGVSLDIDVMANVLPKWSYIVGLYYAPVEDLALAITYRSSNQTKYAIDVDVANGTSIVPDSYIPKVQLDGTFSFSPEQIAFGVAYSPIESLTLSSDVTWYHFAQYQGPFLLEHEGVDFRSIFVPRVGLEWIYEKTFAVRAGYGYRPSPAPTPTREELNLLDGPVHTVSLGLGYRLELSKTSAVSLDAFGSIGIMMQRHAVKAFDEGKYNNYTYGGRLYDFGAQFKFEY